MDVGLAQARQPLCTRSHYFEVEIVEPGEKCYIALGLARRVSKANLFKVARVLVQMMMMMISLYSFTS